jgi:hypothetical protein
MTGYINPDYAIEKGTELQLVSLSKPEGAVSEDVRKVGKRI